MLIVQLLGEELIAREPSLVENVPLFNMVFLETSHGHPDDYWNLCEPLLYVGHQKKEQLYEV